MFFLGLQGEWENRVIKVPTTPGGTAIACYQTVDETGTADCWYVGHDENGKDETLLRHIVLKPEDVMI